MVSTRRSGSKSSSPKEEDNGVAGTKRKEHVTSPKSKHEAKVPKKQTNLEEFVGEVRDQHKDSEMKDPPTEEGSKEPIGSEGNKTEDQQPSEKGQQEAKEQFQDGATKVENAKTDQGETSSNGAVLDSPQRASQLPSNILEKGVIYFFVRNRVSVDDADSVGDLARTYFVLRPLPLGAKLSDGTIPDGKNNRLFALPKKVFPKSHNDRFMAFVEKANTTIQDLKDNFFQGSEYETQTAGTRRTKPVTPVAEGVYIITRTEDRTTHLVYATTIPTDIGEVQEDLGLRSQGSFVVSVKNPERSGPANASLPQKPDFPKEIIEEFRGLAWSEVKPIYLDYSNCQILLIGENSEKATEPISKDQKHGKEAPNQELEQLEHEDELRIKHLKGEDSVFEDLKISKNDYPSVPTTW